jgi:hypothetical protein
MMAEKKEKFTEGASSSGSSELLRMPGSWILVYVCITYIMLILQYLGPFLTTRTDAVLYEPMRCRCHVGSYVETESFLTIKNNLSV